MLDIDLKQRIQQLTKAIAAEKARELAEEIQFMLIGGEYGAPTSFKLKFPATSVIGSME